MFILKLILVCTFGLAFQLSLKSKSQADTSKKANVQYSFFDFIKTDYGIIIKTYIVLGLFMMIAGPALDPTVILAKNEPVTFFFGLFMLQTSVFYEMFLLTVSATIGYSGMDIALRFFGKTTGLIKNAIDYKTTQADRANGTENEPTPVK
jgi:hypothetical protein